MEISLLQTAFIGIFAYLGSLSVPWFLGLTGGWYTLSRPLVSGFIIGLILGDVQTGIIVGVAVQVVYIALVTPGGQMPQDLNSAAYIGVTLGIFAVQGGATVGSAIAIATAVGAIGTVFHNFMMVTNSFWNHRVIAAIEKADYKGLMLNHYIWPQIIQFLYRFIPTALVVYFGSSLATNIINAFPMDSFTMRTLTALGTMLPAVGVAILLTLVIKKNLEIVFFLVGFTFIAAMGVNMVALAIIGAFFAYLFFTFSYTKPAVDVVSDVEEEL